MIYRAILIFCCGVLAGCGNRNPGPPPVLSIANGQYAANIGGACLGLEFGRRDRQIFALDADCDGQPEAQSDFAVDDDVIQTESGSLTVTAVGGTSFSGLWTQGETSTQARFERVVSR